MKLKDWLDEQDLSMAEFGRRIGKSKTTVSRWCSGERIPPIKTAQEISKHTQGEVTAEDFYEDEA